MQYKFLGTNPYRHDSNQRKQQHITSTIDGFQPKSFKSSKNNRINFDRANDRESTLKSIVDQDDEDFMNSSLGGVHVSKLSINLEGIKKRVMQILGSAIVNLGKVVRDDDTNQDPKSNKRARLSKVQLNYYGEDEDEVEERLPLLFKPSHGSIKFQKRKLKSKNAGQTISNVSRNNHVSFAKSTQVHEFEVSTLPTKSIDPAQWKYFKLCDNNKPRENNEILPAQRQSLKREEYRLLLENLEFIQVNPSDYRAVLRTQETTGNINESDWKIELYLYISSRLLSDDDENDDSVRTPVTDFFDNLLYKYLNNFKSSKFTDDDDNGSAPGSRDRHRRIEKDIYVSPMILKNLV
ncbi:hypothetical protein CANARDRAFT_24547 [[Candida] arabinofermentans NRRL YB-2248]|uniref:Uncharacterized protein n=1 Tax=[Candida] arabinofermentans NRRL YB-2248 TaxID=983967 RepID=A0A1E4SWF7_9ASCO|nr:hypothetical protein CANARDRAFT_24547 [[Candida] arabinofermentans NRRL YB-2248]